MISRGLLLLAIAVSVFVLSACGGGGGGNDTAGETPTVEEQVRTVTSDDGKLTLEIPVTAVDEDTEITATAVPLDELPDELQVVQGAGTGYRLEPDGLAFAEPVAVALELDRSELNEDPDGGVTAHALVSLGSDGELELLDDLVTEASLGSDTIVARGSLRHFSWLTRTQGSLMVRLEEVDIMQPVGATFTAGAIMTNTDASGKVLLRAANGEFLTVLGDVAVVGERVFGPADLAGGVQTGGVGTYECPDEEVSDFYAVRAYATSVVDGKEALLTVWVAGDVDCVAGLPPTPTELPTEERVLVIQSAGCVHAGMESILLDSVALIYLSGEVGPGVPHFNVDAWPVSLLDSGMTVGASVEGPGVLESSVSAVTDSNAMALLEFPINAYGPYTITIESVAGPDGSSFEMVPDSLSVMTYDVGDVCTPPGVTSVGDAGCAELGDVNGDGIVDLGDSILVAQFLAGVVDSLPCPDAADANGDGHVGMSDAGAITEVFMRLGQ